MARYFFAALVSTSASLQGHASSGRAPYWNNNWWILAFFFSLLFFFFNNSLNGQGESLKKQGRWWRWFNHQLKRTSVKEIWKFLEKGNEIDVFSRLAVILLLIIVYTHTKPLIIYFCCEDGHTFWDSHRPHGQRFLTFIHLWRTICFLFLPSYFSFAIGQREEANKNYYVTL